MRIAVSTGVSLLPAPHPSGKNRKARRNRRGTMSTADLVVLAAVVLFVMFCVAGGFSLAALDDDCEARGGVFVTAWDGVSLECVDKVRR